MRNRKRTYTYRSNNPIAVIAVFLAAVLAYITLYLGMIGLVVFVIVKVLQHLAVI